MNKASVAFEFPYRFCGRLHSPPPPPPPKNTTNDKNKNHGMCMAIGRDKRRSDEAGGAGLS